jgi:hypothetical protein
MYEGVLFVGGEIEALGNDAVIKDPAEEDRRMIEEALSGAGIQRRPAFRRVESGRRLWNFEKKELEVWKEAL